jgi:hypothetical protein
LNRSVAAESPGVGSAFDGLASAFSVSGLVACATIAARTAGSFHSPSAIVIVLTFIASVTTVAMSSRISCVLRLYHPETRAMVSSNQVSRPLRNASRSPRALSSVVTRVYLTWSGKLEATILVRIARRTSRSLTRPLSPSRAASGATVSMSASAKDRGEMYEGRLNRARLETDARTCCLYSGLMSGCSYNRVSRPCSAGGSGAPPVGRAIFSAEGIGSFPVSGLSILRSPFSSVAARSARTAAINS